MQKGLVFFLFCLLISCQLPCADAGKIISIEGKEGLFMKMDPAEKEIRAENGMTVSSGQYLRTGKDTTAELKLLSGGSETTVRIRQNSSVKIVDKINEGKKNGVFLFFGRLWSRFKGSGPSGYAVETYNSVAGVEGTEFEVGYAEEQKKTFLKVSEGKVRFYAKLVKIPGIMRFVDCTPGQIAIAVDTRPLEVFTEGKSGKFETVQQEMNDLVNARKTVYETVAVDDSGVALFNPDTRVDFEPDSGEMMLMLKFLKKEKFSDKSFIALDCVAYVWINGGNYYQGKRLEYQPGQHIILENLPREGPYDVSVLCGGFQHSFTIDMSEAENREYTHEIKFNVKQVGFRDKIGKKDIGPTQVLRKFKISINSQDMKLYRGNPSIHKDPSNLYIGWDSQKVCFFFPAEINNFSVTVDSDVFKRRVIPINLSAAEEGQYDYRDYMGWFYWLEAKADSGKK